MPIRLPVVYDDTPPAERRAIREEYVRLQKGLCWYCKGPLSDKSIHEVAKKKINAWRFPPDFLKWPVHLHHDHNTGLTIGAVHAYCNAVSFDYDESPLDQE